jgi:hypothetical protein
LLIVAAQPAEGQTYRVIYNFDGGVDGRYPQGLTMDTAGNPTGPPVMAAQMVSAAFSS